jgi:hypothetical protein
MTAEEKIQRVEKALQDAGYETGAIIETARGIHTVYSVDILLTIFQKGDCPYQIFVAVTPDEDKLIIFDPKITIDL